jgi:hypothetical protein
VLELPDQCTFNANCLTNFSIFWRISNLQVHKKLMTVPLKIKRLHSNIVSWISWFHLNYHESRIVIPLSAILLFLTYLFFYCPFCNNNYFFTITLLVPLLLLYVLILSHSHVLLFSQPPTAPVASQGFVPSLSNADAPLLTMGLYPDKPILRWKYHKSKYI